jgi:hypothetical protein
MLHLHECAKPAHAESDVEPLHSIGDFAAIEESAIQPLILLMTLLLLSLLLGLFSLLLT